MDSSDRLARSFADRYFDEWVALDSVNAAVGMRISWHSGNFELIDSFRNKFFLTVNLRNLEDSSIFFPSVYGSLYSIFSNDFWEEFRRLSSLIDQT